MDGGAWWAAVRGVAKSQTWLRNFTFTFHFHALEKEMAPHSSTLAWKIPWMEEPGRLQSMGSLRVGHDWTTSLSPFTLVHWRRKWQPTPVFLPGESQGWGSLVGCRLWSHTESDTTEETAAAAGWLNQKKKRETKIKIVGGDIEKSKPPSTAIGEVKWYSRWRREPGGSSEI